MCEGHSDLVRSFCHQHLASAALHVVATRGPHSQWPYIVDLQPVSCCPTVVKGGNAAVRILAAFPTIRQASGALDLFLSDMSPRAYWWCKVNRAYHVL